MVFILTWLVLGAAAILLASHAPTFVKDAVPDFIKNAYYVATNRFAGKLGSESDWKLLEQSRWIADGSDQAPRVVYVFTDLNCPYCEQFWVDARPWVNAGKVQLRHVVVGILSPSSPGKAAALLVAPDPSAALADFESHTETAASQALPTGRSSSRGSSGVLTPLQVIPPEIQSQLDSNRTLMKTDGLSGTPAVVWRNKREEVRMRAGAPNAALAEILGPL
jgi:thiol:disulfide interchange protein DsbG